MNHDDNLLNPESESVMAQIQSIMEHILAMIHSGSNNDATTFDPDMDENVFYNEWDGDKIVTTVVCIIANVPSDTEESMTGLQNTETSNR